MTQSQGVRQPLRSGFASFGINDKKKFDLVKQKGGVLTGGEHD